MHIINTPTSSDLSLLPRADLPVIWDEFRAKAEQLRETANTLVVSSVEEKDKMELARTTRLTLKQIRVAVEKKRVELGEGYFIEIQKINGAARKLKEMIEPLEARLLHEEQFADRVEADRVLELTKRRNDEVRAIWPGCPGDFGRMPDEEYNALIIRLRTEAALMAEEKRKQVEAEAALAVQLVEQKKLREEQAAQARAAQAEADQRLASERAELQRQTERVRREYEEQAAQARAAQAAKDAAAEVVRQEERAIEEAKRLELEVQLANERAAKLAEERRLFKLALAPDVEQLKAFSEGIFNVPQPWLKTKEASAVLERAQGKLAEAMLIIDVFLNEE